MHGTLTSPARNSRISRLVPEQSYASPFVNRLDGSHGAGQSSFRSTDCVIENMMTTSTGLPIKPILRNSAMYFTQQSPIHRQVGGQQVVLQRMPSTLRDSRTNSGISQVGAKSESTSQLTNVMHLNNNVNNSTSNTSVIVKSRNATMIEQQQGNPMLSSVRTAIGSSRMPHAGITVPTGSSTSGLLQRSGFELKVHRKANQETQNHQELSRMTEFLKKERIKSQRFIKRSQRSVARIQQELENDKHSLQLQQQQNKQQHEQIELQQQQQQQKQQRSNEQIIPSASSSQQSLHLNGVLGNSHTMNTIATHFREPEELKKCMEETLRAKEVKNLMDTIQFERVKQTVRQTASMIKSLKEDGIYEFQYLKEHEKDEASLEQPLSVLLQFNVQAPQNAQQRQAAMQIAHRRLRQAMSSEVSIKNRVTLDFFEDNEGKKQLKKRNNDEPLTEKKKNTSMGNLKTKMPRKMLHGGYEMEYVNPLGFKVRVQHLPNRSRTGSKTRDALQRNVSEKDFID